MASKAIRGLPRGTGSGLQRLCAALFFCGTPRSLIRASFGEARRTLRHAVRRPLPHRGERRSVYKTPIAQLKCPCVNQVEDLLVFGAFLLPELRDLVHLHHMFSIDNWSFIV